MFSRNMEHANKTHVQQMNSMRNLKDLDAFAREMQRESQQKQKRKACVRNSCLFLVVVVCALMLSTIFWVPSDKMMMKHRFRWFDGDNAATVNQCELDFSGNMSLSFLELIEMFEEMEELGLDGTEYCRPEELQIPDEGCDWLNPTIPKTRGKDNNTDEFALEEWDFAHERNMDKIADRIESGVFPDVVLVGDTMVEHWEGKELGVYSDNLKNDRRAFELLFDKENGGAEIDGLAMGITGDRCSNLLYRLENGEMPKVFKPKIWWLVIGTKDWEMGLGADAIVSGILKIVETIRLVHKDAYIVINSILPRGTGPIGNGKDSNPVYASLQDINDRLSCYVSAEHRPRIDFFNATDIFITQHTEDEHYYVDKAMMPDYVYPGAHGELKWGREIVAHVMNLTGIAAEN